jgi:hypothetical protein
VNVRLTLLRLHLPVPVRRYILRELIAAMGRAFERTPPRMEGRSVRALSATAVERSSTWAQDAIAGDADLGELEGRLFSEAFALGARVARRLHLGGETEGLVAARLVYGAIGIDLRSRSHGEVVVQRCAFARAYRPDVCRLMSSMDSGLIAGLTGADGLRFTARLTEGAPACRARVLHAGGIP